MSGEREAASRRSHPVSAAELPVLARALLADGFRLALMAAHEDEEAFRVVYLFIAGSPDRRAELTAHCDRSTPQVPSLAALSFSASRFEREMRDLYGIVPLDHPLPRRLVRHQHWPRGWHPMRSDAGPPPPFESTDEPYPFLTVDGPGVYEIPVGPIHAGLIEPGHFRFSVVGETILKLKARLWFTHKGIERLAKGRSVDDALALAERVSGDTTVGHTLAYCPAVEDALGWEVPAQAGVLRAMKFVLLCPRRSLLGPRSTRIATTGSSARWSCCRPKSTRTHGNRKMKPEVRAGAIDPERGCDRARRP